MLRTGSADDPAGKGGVAGLVARMLIDGGFGAPKRLALLLVMCLAARYHRLPGAQPDFAEAGSGRTRARDGAA